MKKNICLFAGLVLLIFVWANNVFADEKIGFINLQEIIQNSTAGKKAGDEFKKIADKKGETIKAAQNELKKMKEELDKQAALMPQSVRSEKEAAFQKKLRDYQILEKDTTEELQRRDQELSQKLIPEVLKAVRAIGEREKYTLILDLATMPVPYHAKANEISKKVIDEFNKTQGTKK